MAKLNKLTLLLIPSLFLFTSCSKTSTNLSENDAKKFIHDHFGETMDNLKLPNADSKATWKITKENTSAEEHIPTKEYVGHFITGKAVADLASKKSVVIADKVRERYFKELEEFLTENDNDVFIAMNDKAYEYLRYKSTQGDRFHTLQYNHSGKGLKIASIYSADTLDKTITYTHIYDAKGRETKFQLDYYDAREGEEETYTFTLNFKYDK